VTRVHAALVLLSVAAVALAPSGAGAAKAPAKAPAAAQPSASADAPSAVPDLPVLNDCDVAAVVGGEPITVRALDLMGPVQLVLLKDDIYRARLQALDTAIGRRLVEMEAKAQGMSASAYFESQTKALAPPVTEAEVDALWKDTPSLAEKGTKEELHDRIVQHLQQMHEEELGGALVQRLSQKYASQVDVKLKSPREALPIDGAPSRGPASAPVTIVLYADFECGACAAMTKVIDEVAAAHPGDVRVVHLDYPNEAHEHAVAAAAAGRCADRFGHFWEFHDRLFGGAEAQVTDDQLRAVAGDLGIDPQAFDECFTSDALRAQVLADRERAHEHGVFGTPHLFVNGLPLPGMVEKDFLDRLVRTEISMAGQRGAG